MSRGRVSGGSRLLSVDADHAAIQTWHGLVDTLRLLPSVSHTSFSTKSMTEEDLRQAESERRTLDEAIEKVSMLINQRRAGSTSAPSPVPSVSTPGPSGGGGMLGARSRADSVGLAATSPQPYGIGNGDGYGTSNLGQVSTPTSHAGGGKRKRRPSVSRSPVPSASGLGGGVSSSSAAITMTAPHTGGSESALSSVPSPLPPGLERGNGGRGGTPSAKDAAAASARMKKEMYSSQLPLQPGRRVIVKEKKRGKGEMEEEADELKWILGRIKKCIGMDRMRYEVQDEDDGTTWNTTLRFIIPLPDPDAPMSSPAHPNNIVGFPRGTKVLALYPDTTEFYAATVISPPLPPPKSGTSAARAAAAASGSGGTVGSGSGKEGMYKLEFADDDGRVNEVNKDFVVAHPE